MIGVNIIGVYKPGIKIKKSRRGLFTDYCGGKVTNECILRAKKSKNPKLRKRAIFAENARGWAKKHTNGGEININLPELIVTPKLKLIELHNKYILNIPEPIRNKINKLPYRTIVTKYRDPVERFMEVYDKAGNPKINMNALDITGEKRPYYTGVFNTINIPKGSDPYKGVIAELAHPIGGEYNWIQHLKNIYNEVINKSKSHYNDKDNFEYKTHRLIEPRLKNYIEGKSEKYK